MEHAARMAVLALSNTLASSSLDAAPRGGWSPYLGLDARMDPSLAEGQEPTSMRWIPADFREQVEIRYLSASSAGARSTAARFSGGGLSRHLGPPPRVEESASAASEDSESEERVVEEAAKEDSASHSPFWLQ